MNERKKKIFQDYKIIFQISNSACMTRNIFWFRKKNKNTWKNRTTLFVVKTKQQTLRNEDRKVNNDQPIFERKFPSRNDCTVKINYGRVLPIGKAMSENSNPSSWWRSLVNEDHKIGKISRYIAKFLTSRIILIYFNNIQNHFQIIRSWELREKVDPSPVDKLIFSSVTKQKTMNFYKM